MAALPNIPLIPVEQTIRQMNLLDTMNLATSFFIDVTNRSLDELKYLLFTIRRIFDGRGANVIRHEALDLYTALGITSITDTSTAAQSDLVIAIARYYIYRSSHP